MDCNLLRFNRLQSIITKIKMPFEISRKGNTTGGMVALISMSSFILCLTVSTESAKRLTKNSSETDY